MRTLGKRFEIPFQLVVDIPYPSILPTFFSMDANPTYIVEFPPLPVAPPRIPSDTTPTFVAPPTTIPTGFGHPNAYDAFMEDDSDPPDINNMDADDIPHNLPEIPAVESQLPAFLELVG